MFRVAGKRPVGGPPEPIRRAIATQARPQHLRKGAIEE